MLHIDDKTARKVFHGLCEEGYITLSTNHNVDNDRWENTVKGNALAMATARKAITRRTAERLIAEFLDRVQEINNCDDYLYRIKQVVIFGSYLSDTQSLGDVDLSVLIEARYTDDQEQTKHWQERIHSVIQKGRHFRTFLEQQGWPQIEIFQTLKGHSPSISIHDERLEQALTDHTPSKILFNLDKI